MPASLKILIVPLDWGLGHATRCIPLIRSLQQQGHHIVLAGSGAQARLLSGNFPEIPVLPLDGYRIRYSKSRRAFAALMIAQIPKILSAIRDERRWLAKIQMAHRFDLVISDNRYGLHHPQLPCVIMTHQLQILSGSGRLADGLLRRLHFRMLNRFSACWVVDEAEGGGLSGALAHPAVLPPHARYTGLLSQFAGNETTVPGDTDGRHILLLLSGPEPMRSQLEQQLLRQAATLTQYRFSLVAGNPGGTTPQLPPHISYYTHLESARLRPLLLDAALVVCRSGYSTVMDLAVLGKKALLVPTPGQTEQEYLAGYLSAKGYFQQKTQAGLSLAADIPLALAASPCPLHSARLPDILPDLMADLGFGAGIPAGAHRSGLAR